MPTGHLRVLVSVSCAGCAQALALAGRVARRYPRVEVEIVNVDRAGWSPPRDFAGTPMFYLGDTVLSYGNPTWEQLDAALSGEAV